MALLLSALTFWSAARGGSVPENGMHPVVQRAVPLTGLVEVDRLRHLDAQWYLDIAQNGYRLDRDQANVVFFPLLPALIRGTSELTGWTLGFSGQVLAVLFTMWACGLLALFARDLIGPEERRFARSERLQRLLALGAPALLLLHPMGVFLQTVYPESLFIALCLSLLLALRRERVWLTTALCFVLALTRPQGLFVPLALVGVDAWSSWRSRRIELRRVTVLGSLAAVAAVLLFAAYLGHVTGEPWSFWTKRSAWDHDSSLLHIPRLLAPIITRQELMAKLTLYLTLAGAWLLWRRGERVGGLLCALFIVLPLQKGNLGDIMRYSLLAIPAVVPLLFGVSRLPLLVFGGIGAAAFMHGFFLLRFLQGLWVG
jgi:hypothetical protein